MRFIATITGYLGVVVANAVFATLVLLCGLVDSHGRFWWFMGRMWGRTIYWGALSRVCSRGFERLSWNEPAILMANHESYMDVPALITACPVPLRFVARKEVFAVPIMGSAMRVTGQISVDRSNRERAIESLKAAAGHIADGRTVLLFPEGTRSGDGSLGPFKKGGFMLALQAGVPIVPVGVAGTRDIVPRGGWTFRPGTVRVVVGDPISTAELTVDDRDELMAQVRGAIKTARDSARTG